MSDWTTARVVRDCYGDLWGSEDDNPGAWTRLGCDWMNAEPERELERDCGPLTPVLDADGLPVVRTVGDLTLRQIRQRPQIMLAVGEYKGTLSSGRQLGLLTTDDGEAALLPVDLDTPIEVLS